MNDGNGITASERYLSNLCRNNFLSLWSHSNLYMQPGEELCDLLVLCPPDLIIFSDKHCSLGNSGDIDLDWSRWYRRAIKRSASQIYRAEHWLSRHPSSLFTDAKCKSSFRYGHLLTEVKNVHRVAVTRGIRNDVIRHFGGGSGSLLVFGGAKAISDGNQAELFTASQPDGHRGFVHILDEVSLDCVLRTLDTIGDFVKYLREKERFFLQTAWVHACGEEELLAYYLRGFNTEKNCYEFRVPSDIDGVSIDEGLWQDLIANEQYLARLEANRISYLWDELIERTAAHAKNGTLWRGNEQPMESHELLLRTLARESRFSRRVLADGLLGAISKPVFGAECRFRPMPSLVDSSLFYLVGVFPPRKAGDVEETYRMRRVELLRRHSHCVAYRNVNVRRVVAIGTESGRGYGQRSEDLIYWEVPERDDKFNRVGKMYNDALRSSDQYMREIHRFHYEDFPLPPKGSVPANDKKKYPYKKRRRKSR